MFESYGRVVYDPYRNMKTNTKNWLVLEIDEDLCRYYRWHLDRHWWYYDDYSVKRIYSRPSHKAHISIIRGEKIRKNYSDWNKFLARKKLKFSFEPDIRMTSLSRDGKDHFFFIDVMFPEYNELRDHFGLDTSRNGIPFKGHFTFARVM